VKRKTQQPQAYTTYTCLLLYVTTYYVPYLGCGYIRHSEDSASLFVSYCYW